MEKFRAHEQSKRTFKNKVRAASAALAIGGFGFGVAGPAIVDGVKTYTQTMSEVSPINRQLSNPHTTLSQRPSLYRRQNKIWTRAASHYDTDLKQFLTGIGLLLGSGAVVLYSRRRDS